jgi:hypothetical protein
VARKGFASNDLTTLIAPEMRLIEVPRGYFPIKRA